MNSYLDIDNRFDSEAVSNWFSIFLADRSAIPSLTLTKKSELVSALVGDLDENGVQQNWDKQARLLALQTLKTLGRDPKGCERLLSDEGLRVLMMHAALIPEAGALNDTPVSQEALTCIANALLLKEFTRDLFEKYQGVPSSTIRLQDNNLSLMSQFLFSRILFLMTVRPGSVVQQLVDELGIIDILTNTISIHVKELSSSESSNEQHSSITNEMVLSEQLKLLFNLMLNDPKIERDGKGKDAVVGSKFKELLYPVRQIIMCVEPPSPLPLAPPHSHAIHALLNFPVTVYKSVWFPSESEQHTFLDKLMGILKTMIFIAVDGDPDEENNNDTLYGVDFDEVITPLVALLKRLAEEDETAKRLLKSKLLPDDMDRSKPLEQGGSLTARLIRLMTSIMLSNLRDNVCELLFILCGEDVNFLTHYVGYGNAAGFLMNRKMMFPPASSGKSPIQSDKAINPITGQYCQDESPSLSEMTDEEKEREAERLFVLFERLKKTGVVNVVNPVEQAIKSGKIQEIDSDEEESD